MWSSGASTEPGLSEGGMPNRDFSNAATIKLVRFLDVAFARVVGERLQADSHPFVAPEISPPTRRPESHTNAMMTGSVATSDAAIISGQLYENCVT